MRRARTKHFDLRVKRAMAGGMRTVINSNGFKAGEAKEEQ